MNKFMVDALKKNEREFTAIADCLKEADSAADIAECMADLLVYVAHTCNDIGYPMDEVAQMALDRGNAN